jgi:hypothetical protein
LRKGEEEEDSFAGLFSGREEENKEDLADLTSLRGRLVFKEL